VRLDAALQLSHVNASELAHLLMEVFPNIRQEESEVFYCKDNDGWAIRLQYKGDAVVSAEGGAQLTTEDLASLSTRVRSDLLGAGTRVVGREIIFTTLPVRGVFRVDDLFQLSPMPEQAPRSNRLLGDHPCVLEIPYVAARSAWLDSARYGQASRDLELILNVLLNGGVRRAARDRGPCWITESPVDGSAPQSHIAARGYHVELGDIDPHAFSAGNESPPMPVVDRATYYHRLGAVPPFEQEVASDTASVARTFFELPANQRRTALRAAHWFLHAAEARVTSSSGALVALDCAIESMVPPAPASQSCDHCGKAMGPSVTQRFRDFLEEIVPSHDDEDISARKKLYSLRSKLAHGWDLMRGDLHPEHFIHPATSEEHGQIWYAGALVRFAIINWICQQSLQDVQC
jgi:hypothetical protein